MTLFRLRARAQLLQIVAISEGSPCKQHKAKIPSQFRRGCKWWREAASVRPPKPTQLEGECDCHRRSTTVATMEDPPNSPQSSLLQDLQYESIIAEQHGGPVGQPAAETSSPISRRRNAPTSRADMDFPCNFPHSSAIRFLFNYSLHCTFVSGSFLFACRCSLKHF